jgi:membrane protease YdiL (CAAX protease family)
MIDNDLWPEERQEEMAEYDWPPYVILLLSLIIVLFSLILGGGLLMAWGQWQGISLESLMNSLSESSSFGERNKVRFAAAVNQLFTFLIPSLLAAVFIARRHWRGFLNLNGQISRKALKFGVFFIVVAFPLAQFTYWFNQQIPLPQWVVELDENTNATIQYLLFTDSYLELFQNLVLIAVIPALGEELLFRGIIQHQLSRWINRPVLAIWITAILFSAIHMQFQGFLPRVFLGAILGYLFYWTGNLWIPIAAHFVNNAFQVILQFFFREELQNAGLDEMGEFSEGLPTEFMIWVPLSVILMIYLGRRLQRLRINQEKINQFPQSDV